MDVTQLEQLTILRSVIGYLGEHDQFAWWQSSFFAPASRAFLAPVFARTPVVAQCVGVTRAAALVHDERIGVGRVYHLFRLPEDLEQSIHSALHDPDLGARITASTVGQNAALAYLRELATSTVTSGIGPTLIGEARALRTADTWRLVTTHYLRAFEQGAQVYPYFIEPK
jgi:hypothetical protein